MNINFNPMGQKPILNVDRINQSVNQSRETDKDKSTQNMSQRDRANLSKAGKFASLMENLINQKQNTIKAKNELITKSNEDGLSLKDIEVQIETFDEQLKNIEGMIESALRKQFEGQEEKDEKVKKTEDEPVTKKEAELKKLNAITVASIDIEKAEKVESLKKGNENEIRILEGEAKQSKLIDKIAKDRERVANKAAKLTNANVKPLDTTNIDNKLDRARELVDQNSELNGIINEEFAVINEDANSNEETSGEINKAEEGNEKES